jgi:hypothetical protein
MIPLWLQIDLVAAFMLGVWLITMSCGRRDE